MLHLEILRGVLYGKNAGDNAHGGEERQASGAIFDSLVGDGSDSVLEEVSGELGIDAGEVEIREERFPFNVREKIVLLRERFFDFHKNIGVFKELRPVFEDLSSGVDILFVGKSGAVARTGFDKNAAARIPDCTHARRRETDTVLVVLCLPKRGDCHSGQGYPECTTQTMRGKVSSERSQP